MDVRKIKKLIELFEASELSEMDISEGDSRIRLLRAGLTATAAAEPFIAAAEPAPVKAGEPAADKAEGKSALEHTVNSPMVGTFYASSSPEEPAFSAVGAMVNAGDVVCIVEAMKTFNQIQTEVSGKIVAVHKQNGDPVEYGEALLTIALLAG